MGIITLKSSITNQKTTNRKPTEIEKIKTYTLLVGYNFSKFFLLFSKKTIPWKIKQEEDNFW
jgi:hypothetical protein